MTLHQTLRKLENGFRQDIVIPPSTAVFLVPIHALVSLGSIKTKATGRVSFALSISAPQNRSQLVRNLVEIMAGKQPDEPVQLALVPEEGEHA